MEDIKRLPKMELAQLEKETATQSTLSNRQAINKDSDLNIITNENESNQKVNKDTLNIIQQEQQQQKEKVPYNNEKEQEHNENKQQKENKQQNITLNQYILMMPMAVVYLLGRTIIDISRGSIYFLLYRGEKAIPIIDAWLFEKVTVWLPNKYEQMETWWMTKGKKRYQAWQTHFFYKTIPRAIDKIDQWIEQLYHFGIWMNEIKQSIKDIWKRFKRQHDWRQLMIDLGQTFYYQVLQPWYSIMIRISHIMMILLKGCKQGFISTWHDIHWLVLHAFPQAMKWMKKSPIWQFSQEVTHHTIYYLNYALQAVVLPVLHGCSHLSHYLFIDILVQQLILSDTTTYYLLQIKKNVINFQIWFCTDAILFLKGVRWLLLSIVDDGFIPLYQSFMHHVLPRLSKGYYNLKSDMIHVYQNYVYPIWEITMSWVEQHFPTIHQCLDHYYHSFITFFSEFEWNWEMIIQLTDHFVLLSQTILSTLLQSISTTFTYFIHHHAIVLKTIQSGWHHVMNTMTNIDWENIMITLEHLHQMIIDQCSSIVASLERTINEWASQQNDNIDKDLKKE
ncbi:unnamed protein product [Cunninghamella blakesleeana]